MGRSQRQLRAMLRKNWLLKIRHPFATCAEVLGRRAPPQSHSAANDCDADAHRNKMIARVYKNEVDLENYIRSELYGVNDQVR
ncbi:hypothetical protein GW17_00032737 [Ensete ventricosum]|nr:hypothetical protein GW17_00032737 [Ensete ventricosum]